MDTSDIPATPATHVSTSGPSVSSSSGSSQRKERGAIAAQACDTCRNRKQKCDERRPQCGTCQKFKLECNYREPQPTKKDKTLVEILDRIKSLEGKVDGLVLQASFASPTSTPYAGPLQHPPIYTTNSPITIASGIHGPPLSTQPFHLPQASSLAPGGEEQYKYVSSVHQMLRWPAMQQLLEAVQLKVPSLDLSVFKQDGPTTALGAHHHNGQNFPATISPTPRGHGSTAGIPSQTPNTTPVTVASLDWETMQRLAKTYFDTINLVYPVLDRESFMSDTLPSLFSTGFSEGMASTIAFLVFALGEVALAGSEGVPVYAHSGRPSGVKGGSREEPPGLEMFNEARKRMGFSLAECSLENVQIFALASIYYGTCFSPMEFWRMTTSASLACQALITSNPSELSSPRGDLIRRTFWHCSILETCLNLEIGFPLTGLEKIEAVVGLPDFSGPFSEADYISNQGSHFQEHFASQIVLRRLLVDFHCILSQCSMNPSSGSNPVSFSQISGVAGFSTITITIHHLALQLEQWRGMLPAHLRWEEESPGAFPSISPNMLSETIYSSASTPISPVVGTNQSSSAAATPPLMFTTDLDAPPARYPYGLDIQVALLRSRYYYTKYLIHRPFLYKALHFPEAMTHDDAAGAAECLKACLKWPVAMSPTCRHKRLVPCQFFFSQNFLGILVLLHMSTTAPILRRIRSTLCGERFEMDAGETVGLYLDWLRDLKSVDNVTAWHWSVAKAIYGLEE